jgi:hypothetical protein
MSKIWTGLFIVKFQLSANFFMAVDPNGMLSAINLNGIPNVAKID